MEQIQTFAGGAALLYAGWVARSWWTRDLRALSFQSTVSIAAGALLLACLIYQAGILRGAGIVTEDMNFKIGHLAAVVHDKLGTPPKTTGQDDQIRKEAAILVGKLTLPVGILFDLFVVWGAGAVTNRLGSARTTNNANAESGKANHKRSGAGPE